MSRGFGRRSGREVRFPGNNDTADDKKEVRMAEGSDEDVEERGAEEAEGNA